MSTCRYFFISLYVEFKKARVFSRTILKGFNCFFCSVRWENIGGKKKIYVYKLHRISKAVWEGCSEKEPYKYTFGLQTINTHEIAPVRHFQYYISRQNKSDFLCRVKAWKKKKTRECFHGETCKYKLRAASLRNPESFYLFHRMGTKKEKNFNDAFYLAWVAEALSRASFVLRRKHEARCGAARRARSLLQALRPAQWLQE